MSSAFCSSSSSSVSFPCPSSLPLSSALLSSSSLHRSPLRLLLLSAAFLLSLSLLFHSTSAASALYFDQPDALVEAIDELSSNTLSPGEVPTNLFSAALFGVALYENMIDGYLVFASDGCFTNTNGSCTNARYGCGDFDVSSNANWAALSADRSVGNVILLVERNPTSGSGCTFSKKVYSAQNAAAGKVRAVLVADTDGENVILMRDDDSGRFVTISSMFIPKQVYLPIVANYNHSDPYGIFVEMEYYLPNPDGRVELDMLFSILDFGAINFLTTFGSAARVLGYRLFSTPHYWVYDGTRTTCKNTTSTKCTDNCLKAEGSGGTHYYCQAPADAGVLFGVTGGQALNEVVRQQCLFTTLASVNSSSKYENAAAYFMWTYWENWYPNCAYSNASIARFSEQCSYDQMTKYVFVLAGLDPSIYFNQVQFCVTQARIADSNGELPIFENMMVQWDTFGPPVQQVTAYVNLHYYYGDVKCRTPITEATCGILSAICYGYNTSTDGPQPYPDACNGDSQCTFGQATCNGTSVIVANNGGSSGVSAGAVVGIIIAFLFILCCGLYYYYRKQQQKMRQEVDHLLKQYLPMDPGATHGVAQGKGAMREQHERRLITDMDLEDQDLETREDI